MHSGLMERDLFDVHRKFEHNHMPASQHFGRAQSADAAIWIIRERRKRVARKPQ